MRWTLITITDIWHKLENCPQRMINIPPTMYQTETVTLTLTSDLDLQSHESIGHDAHTSIRSRSKVTRFKHYRVETDAWTTGWTDRGDGISSRANTVGGTNSADDVQLLMTERKQRDKWWRLRLKIRTTNIRPVMVSNLVVLPSVNKQCSMQTNCSLTGHFNTAAT